MLQRIYGTAWTSEKDLTAYLNMLEEAESEIIGKLASSWVFHLQEEAAGSVFWHAKGWILYREIEAYMRRQLDSLAIAKSKHRTGGQIALGGVWSLGKFGENMFTAQSEDERTLALKPMNCPCHVQIFRQGIKSYRDLPLRMANLILSP